MSLVLDETAGDLPVRDVGLRAGLVHDGGPRRKPQVMKIKERQRVLRQSREQLEELCVRLQEENTLLKHHCKTQDQRICRMSTKLLRLRGGPGPRSGLREAELEEAVQELEGHVSALESQKRALQSKLNLARQHILELGGRTATQNYKPRGRGQIAEGGVRRAAQTAPPRYRRGSHQNSREEMETLSSLIEVEQGRAVELQQTVEALRDSVREKERALEENAREQRRQQADEHRVIIRENIEMIRLQKQLSEKCAALLVIQEKFSVLQKVYETQLEESQQPLRESQEVLLRNAEELNEQLKQERERALCLKAELTTATLTSQALAELQERLNDVAGERDLLRESYNTLLESTMQSHSQEPHCRDRGKQEEAELSEGAELQQLEACLKAVHGERERLAEEKERILQEKRRMEEGLEREREISHSLREKHTSLEQEVSQYREEVTSLQERLDSVTKEFDMSLEELSETFLQIKAFRLQREGEEQLSFLRPDGKLEDCSRELTSLQASHAETVLELNKSRDMLLLQHRINTELQAELKTIKDRSEAEREENRRTMGEKNRLLERRAHRITTLQAQLKDLAYSPKNYRRAIPLQYTWAGDNREVAEQVEDDTIFCQLRAGESLLEIHLRGATFTPAGLRVMARGRDGIKIKSQEVVTFCTYSLLDFDMHSTPLVSGPEPNYGFTSRYPLSARDIGAVQAQGGGVSVEVHQALGGVRFRTCGQAWIPLTETTEMREEKLTASVSITGPEGDVLGMLEFWVRLYPPTELSGTLMDRRTVQPPFSQHTFTWLERAEEDLFDYGGGIPNELEVVLDRCAGLSTSCPGLPPDAYLLYRLYDLPPHASPIVPCSTDPVFGDTVSYPLAVTPHLLTYLRGGSLMVYAFNDRDQPTANSYLAKTAIPLRSLATGRPIRGDYVLRDAGGYPHGTVRVSLRWKFPFQPPQALLSTQEARVSANRPPARRRPHRPPIRIQACQRITPPKHAEQIKAAPHLSPDLSTAPVKPTPAQTTPLQSPSQNKATPICYTAYEQRASHNASARGRTPEPQRQEVWSSAPEAEHLAVGGKDEEEEEQGRAPLESNASESSESCASSGSDVIIMPDPSNAAKKNKLRVEILSLSFDPVSRIALDQSVQRVYVEYRLLGIPMETTETPISLRKPITGEEIHFNFIRVIYVDSPAAETLRLYLFTMLEGTDPNQGRLKFTVVSEPMDDEEECVDIGYAYLDLKQVLQTGSDVIERQLDIVGVAEEEQSVVGRLKVSLEAVGVLREICREHRGAQDRGGETSFEEEEEVHHEDPVKELPTSD